MAWLGFYLGNAFEMSFFRYFNFQFLLGYVHLHTIYKWCYISGSYFTYKVAYMYILHICKSVFSLDYGWEVWYTFVSSTKLNTFPFFSLALNSESMYSSLYDSIDSITENTEQFSSTQHILCSVFFPQNAEQMPWYNMRQI